MPRQSSLTSFFVGAKTGVNKKNGLVQSKLNFSSKTDQKKTDSKKEKKSVENEAKQSFTEENEKDRDCSLVDTSEDEGEDEKDCVHISRQRIVGNKRKKYEPKTAVSQLMKRRQIIDESDEESSDFEKKGEKEKHLEAIKSEAKADLVEDSNKINKGTKDIIPLKSKTEEKEKCPSKAESSVEKKAPSQTPPLLTKKNNGSAKKDTNSYKGSQKSIETESKNDKNSCDWKGSVPYSALCNCFAEIEAISSRLQIQKFLTDLLKKALSMKEQCNDHSSHESTLCSLIYLASNSVAPAYECVELGVGDSLLMKAIIESSGSTRQAVKSNYQVTGDLGITAMQLKKKVRTLNFGSMSAIQPLSCQDVLDAYRKIATTSGKQSQKWKTDIIQKLLVRAKTGIEAKYIIRGLQGKLRIGLAQSTVLISLAHALAQEPPVLLPTRTGIKLEKSSHETILNNKKLPIEQRLDAAANIVKKAYSEVPSYDALIKAALKVPLTQLHLECTLKPGIPVAPMLAKPTKSIQEVLQRLHNTRFTCEFKYDGERAQVHFNTDNDDNGLNFSKVFSRNLLDTTDKYSEVPIYVKEAADAAAAESKDMVPVTSFIMDAEVVAYNRETNQFVPFQILSTRAKKITEKGKQEEAKVKIIVQAFDLMYLNGSSLLNRTLAERRKLLHHHFKPISGKFQFATYLDHTEDGDTAVLEEFLETAVKGQCEGLMVKTLDINAAYEPSRRSLNWLKLKKDYLEGLGDSVDLVPIGAYYGRGKRTGVYGAYLLACYDEDSEEFQSVCKIGTGFSDNDLINLANGLNNHKLSNGKSSQYNVSDTLECDVWFDAIQVWEIKAADLSKSSTHKGAIDKTGEVGRGIGLRFPRFERIRLDKKPEEATTSDQILDLYYAQDSIVNTRNDVTVDDGI